MKQDSTRNGRKTVRFGGVETPEGFLFELTGGHLCLDLVNTLDERRNDVPRELLNSFVDLVAWGLQAGAVDESAAQALRRTAQARPRAAALALHRARLLREALYAIFSAAAGLRVLPAQAVDQLNTALVPALAARRLELIAGRPGWVFVEQNPPNLDRVLWPAILSAAELLTSADLFRVCECAGERCAWLFLDRSKNQSRRWCDMTVCGNRAKARRHFSRVRDRRE